VVQVNDQVWVKVIGVQPENNKISLSIKAVNQSSLHQPTPHVSWARPDAPSPRGALVACVP